MHAYGVAWVYAFRNDSLSASTLLSGGRSWISE